MIATAFILGLLGSFHCVGMCGPIAFLLPLDRKNVVNRTLQIVLYHIGRLFTYGFLGLLFGILGKSFYLFGFQQQLSIIIGILMIVSVLLPQSLLSKYTLLKPIYKLVSKVKSSLGNQLKKRTPDTFFTIGFLNGFLPCGLVYMAVFGAIAMANIWQGGIYMILFGLGTIPLMSVAAYLGNFLKGRSREHVRKLVPVFAVVIGVLFILRGMGLGIQYVSPKPMNPKVEAQMECHDTSLVDSNYINLK